jgi:galactose-1-phosphate uridylyltransferase
MVRMPGPLLEHPHTQIVASPIVPPYVRSKFEVTTQYYENTALPEETASFMRDLRL